MPNFTNSNFFRRIDESSDEFFYEIPRFVVHLDDSAIVAVGAIYTSRLPKGGEILDLMSSWRSHIPERVEPARLVGLGLNRAEMEDNPALTEIVVHNVNRDPRLPFADESFDGAVMTVSVQYLIHPVEIFVEVGRILRPSGPFIVTFSSRMFPTKAIARWQAASELQRVEIVAEYFADSGAFESMETFDQSGPLGADPIWGVAGCRR